MLVFTRFILLEWMRRKHNDKKTIAELFFVCCEDIQDMELSTALHSLMSIFATGIRNGSITIDETIAIFHGFIWEIGENDGDAPVLSAAYCQ